MRVGKLGKLRCFTSKSKSIAIFCNNISRLKIIPSIFLASAVVAHYVLQVKLEAVDPDLRYVIGRDSHLDKSHTQYLGLSNHWKSKIDYAILGYCLFNTGLTSTTLAQH